MYNKLMKLIKSITKALNKTFEIVDIDEAIKGNIYACISCQKDLIPRKGEIRAHHFAHKANYECKYGIETSLTYSQKRS